MLYRVINPKVVQALTGKRYGRRKYVELDEKVGRRGVRLRSLQRIRTQDESMKHLGFVEALDAAVSPSGFSEPVKSKGKKVKRTK